MPKKATMPSFDYMCLKAGVPKHQATLYRAVRSGTHTISEIARSPELMEQFLKSSIRITENQIRRYIKANDILKCDLMEFER